MVDGTRLRLANPSAWPADIVTTTNPETKAEAKGEEKDRNQWKLGIIEELIIGRDGILRGAKLRAGRGVLERPLRQGPLRNIGHRVHKPHSRGLVRSLKETLARAIAQEGPDILDRLRPHTDYTLFKGDDPIMLPDGAYTRKGADISREVIDGPFSLRPLELGPDITDEKSIYWVSCENEDLRVSLVSAGGGLTSRTRYELSAAHCGWKVDQGASSPDLR
ncbi:hypothetical protein QZH41_002578 [Actinostola sp. cb2023]|nr:hypothetical protein QZH41_002578 [Actinostola sp. cb2023]